MKYVTEMFGVVHELMKPFRVLYHEIIENSQQQDEDCNKFLLKNVRKLFGMYGDLKKERSN
jgi:hypothetical protein